MTRIICPLHVDAEFYYNNLQSVFELHVNTALCGIQKTSNKMPAWLVRISFRTTILFPLGDAFISIHVKCTGEFKSIQQSEIHLFILI